MMAYKPFELNSGYFSETMRICHNLKYLKEQTKLSYRKLSKVLGFKDKTILNYVYGYTRPNPERLQIIAELKVSKIFVWMKRLLPKSIQ